MSFHFDDRRHRVLAVENGLPGQVHAQPEYEVTCRRGQPVGFMACRSGVLNVNVDGTIGIQDESRAIADAVAIDRIRHKVIFGVTHGERPECIVRRKTARRKVHDVIVRSGEPLACAIYFRGPVHRLLRQVYWTHECFIARGFEQDAIAGLAASENGGPAVYLCDIGVRENPEREEPQHAANDDSLDYIRDDGSPEHTIMPPFAAFASTAPTVCRSAVALFCGRLRRRVGHPFQDENMP
jgi:hypothetical protein